VHVLVATDGKLEVDQVVSLVAPLAAGGTVTVVTVTEIPRNLLRDLRTDFGEKPGPSVATDAEYVGVSGSGSDPGINYPGDDAIVGQYLSNRRADTCEPMVDGFTAAGITASCESLEGENAARTILEYVRNGGIDLVVVGSHGQGRFEGLLGSTGTKVIRLSPVPVLVIRKSD